MAYPDIAGIAWTPNSADQQKGKLRELFMWHMEGNLRPALGLYFWNEQN